MAKARSLDGVLTKKAHTKESFTEQNVQELVACADHDTGYHYFCSNYFYIQHPVKGKMLFQPFEYQTRLLDAYHGHRFTVNMLPRQMGKCLKGDTTKINIRNKHTGEIRELSIQEFYELQKNSGRK